MLDKRIPKCYTIIRKRQENKTKERLKMMINFDTYEQIADLLAEGGDNPTYSVEEIADMVGVEIDVVEYVDLAEYDVM